MATELDRESELLWVAFRYVSGEIGPDEAEAFERRLDQDQEAREAVARAVELTGAVAQLRPETGAVLALQRRRTVRMVQGVAALAAAACLAWLVVAAHGPASQTSAPGTGASVNATPSATVTLAWLTLRQEREGDKDETGALIAPNEDLPTPSETEDAADAGLPLWLLDAASLAGPRDHAAAPAKEL